MSESWAPMMPNANKSIETWTPPVVMLYNVYWNVSLVEQQKFLGPLEKSDDLVGAFSRISGDGIQNTGGAPDNRTMLPLSNDADARWEVLSMWMERCWD